MLNIHNKYLYDVFIIFNSFSNLIYIQITKKLKRKETFIEQSINIYQIYKVNLYQDCFRNILECKCSNQINKKMGSMGLRMYIKINYFQNYNRIKMWSYLFKDLINFIKSTIIFYKFLYSQFQELRELIQSI